MAQSSNMSENLENILCLIIDMCRICLDNHGSKDLLESASLASDVYKCTGIKVVAADKLPTQICQQCLHMVEIAKELRLLAEKSANKLKKFICTKQKDDESFIPDAMVQIPDTVYGDKNGMHTKEFEAGESIADNSDSSCPRDMIEGPGISDAAGLLVMRPDMYEEYVPEYVGSTSSEKESENKYELNKNKIKSPNESKKVKPTRTSERVNSKSSSDKVKSKTSCEKVKSRTGSEKVKSKTSSAKVESNTRSEKVESKTSSENVVSKTKSANVESKTKSANVESKTKSANVETKTNSAKVESKTVSGSENSITSEKIDKRRKEYREIMQQKRKREMDEKIRIAKAMNEQKQKILERVKRLTRQSLELKCKKCSKEFKNHKALSLHMRTHIRPEVCQYCSKRFGFKNDLAKHIRTHTGEKPYKCTLCEKAFTQNGTLKTHMETVHSGERHDVSSGNA